MRNDGAVRLRQSATSLWRPPKKITVSEWAENNVVLESASASESGAWRNSRTPYLVEIMNAWADPTIEEIVTLKASQIGGTAALLNCLGYSIEHDPGPCLIVYPDEGEARKVSDNRIHPMVNTCPALRAKKPANPDDFTKQSMKFPGMPIWVVGSNSPADLASNPCRYVIFDEIDKYPLFSGREASPIDLGTERQKTFWNRKRFKTSTPTIEGGAIDKAWNACDERRYYHVPCPHCGAEQAFVFEQLRWPEDIDRESVEYLAMVQRLAWYECSHCAGKIYESHKTKMLRAGHWVAEKKHPRPKSVGFHLNSLYSPFLTIGDCARAMEEAERGDLSKKMNFCNSWKGQPWKSVSIESAKIELVSKVLPDLPSMTVPTEAVAITCGIDMQKYGFYASVWAFTERLKSWKILDTFLSSWDEVAALVFETQFKRQGSGEPVMIWRAAIDTGGSRHNEDEWSRTAEAYHWIRFNNRGVILATKGMSEPKPGTPLVKHTILDRMPGKNGQVIPGGLVLWLINTERMKETFFHRLQCTAGDEQQISFCAGTGDAFFKQITAEEKRINNKGKHYWHRIRRDNHHLDTSMLAHACADSEWAGGVPMLALQVSKLDEQEQGRGEDNAGGWLPSRNSWLNNRRR